MFKEKDAKYVIAVLSIIAVIMIYLMITNFKWIDFTYFIVVITTVCRYLLLCRE